MSALQVHMFAHRLQLLTSSTHLRVIEGRFSCLSLHYTAFRFRRKRRSTVFVRKLRNTCCPDIALNSRSLILQYLYPVVHPCQTVQMSNDEWLGTNLDTNLQIHILTAIYGSKISLNTLRRVLNNLNVHHENKDSIGQLHRRLKGYITDLRKGKKAEQVQEQERAAHAKYDEEVEAIRQLWPQLIPQSVKNNCIRKFRDQTCSAALSTFTCASCAESVSLRFHCSVAIGDSKFDLSVLKRPDLKSDEANLLDRYKWLHPDCVPPTMPFNEGLLCDLLLDPDGIFFPTDGSPPVLSLCQPCHSDLKREKMPALSLANKHFSDRFPASSKT